MPWERLRKQTLYAEVSGKRSIGRPRIRWLDSINDFGRSRLELHPSEMQSVMVNREVWRLIWSCCPRNPLGIGKKKNTLLLP